MTTDEPRTQSGNRMVAELAGAVDERTVVRFVLAIEAEARQKPLFGMRDEPNCAVCVHPAHAGRSVCGAEGDHWALGCPCVIGNAELSGEPARRPAG